jgi:hypothetical protein
LALKVPPRSFATGPRGDQTVRVDRRRVDPGLEVREFVERLRQREGRSERARHAPRELLYPSAAEEGADDASDPVRAR